jgi:hypothetical protein
MITDRKYSDAMSKEQLEQAYEEIDTVNLNESYQPEVNTNED